MLCVALRFSPVYDGYMSDDDWDIEPTLASAVRAGRAWTRQTMRMLAKASGVSPAQISRIEAGKVTRPTMDTLLALAAGLDQHPTPMLVLGKQLTGKAARRQLSELLADIADTTAEPEEREGVNRLRSSLSDASPEHLRQIAIEALTYSSKSTLWPETLRRAVPANVPDHDLFGRLLSSWAEMTPARHWRLVELSEDLRTASLAERAAGAPSDPLKGTS